MDGLPHLMDLFLQPGEFIVADASYKLRTLLGSCVSITLWHPETRTGGMSHFLLPSRGRARRPKRLDARYGDEALQLMLEELRQLGIAPAQCQAKVFGGGNMFPDLEHPGGLVGQRTGEAAISLLGEQGISILSESLFGVGHRQIIFDVSNGDVWSSQIAPSAAPTEGDLL